LPVYVSTLISHVPCLVASPLLEMVCPCEFLSFMRASMKSVLCVEVSHINWIAALNYPPKEKSKSWSRNLMTQATAHLPRNPPTLAITHTMQLIIGHSFSKEKNLTALRPSSKENLQLETSRHYFSALYFFFPTASSH